MHCEGLGFFLLDFGGISNDMGLNNATHASSLNVEP
jgi:hypothetical protein